jgi:hypothetical protein
MRELAFALNDEVHTDGAEAFDEVVGKLTESRPDLIIVCYAFDEVRPFRLLHYVRDEWRAHVPTILVRALPIPLGTTEEARIRESYKTLGVDEFVNLNDDKQRLGKEAALRIFRDVVISRLPSAPYHVMRRPA